MHALPHTHLRGRLAILERDRDRGNDTSSIAVAHRDSLRRGLVFVLLLTSSLLASVYVPLALHEDGWTEGTAPISLADVR